MPLSNVHGFSNRLFILFVFVFWAIAPKGPFCRAADASVTACDNGTKRLHSWMINDDFCDCEDGSDEDMTSACSSVAGSRFTCNHSEYGAQNSFPSSRVNDGICDCCDGSDEQQGLCTSSCAEKAEKIRLSAINEYFELSLAWRERQSLVLGMQRSASAKDKEVAKIEEELKLLKLLLQKLQLLQYVEEKKERKEQIASAKGEEITELERKDYTVMEKQLKAGRRVRKEGDKRKHIFEQMTDYPSINKIMESEVEYIVTTLSSENKSKEEKVEGANEVGEGNSDDKEEPSRTLSMRTLYAYISDPSVKELRKQNYNSIEELRQRSLLGPVINAGPGGWRRGARALLCLAGLPAALPLRAAAALMGALGRAALAGLGVLADLIEDKFDDERPADFIEKFQKEGLAALHPRLEWRRYEALVSIQRRIVTAIEPYEWALTAIWDAPFEVYRYFVPKLDRSHIRAEAELVRKALIEGKKQQSKLEKDQKSAITERDGSKDIDYGEDKAYMALDGECFEGNFGEFTYKVCPFGQANQGRTRIGKFDRWGEGQHGPEGQTPTMYYTKGQTCHGGLARKAEVVLRCAATSGLVEAEEPEVCSYALTLTTPLACYRQGLATAEARLVALGVDKDKISSSRDHQNGPAVVSQQQQQKSDIFSARQQTSSQDADDDEEEPHQFSPSSKSSSSSQKEKNNRGEEL